MKKITIWLLLLLVFTSLGSFAQRKMEKLGRGTYAVRTNASQVFVSWRLTGDEYAQNAVYNLYRNGSKIASNLTVSNFVDNTATNGTYSIAAVIKGVEQTLSPTVSVNPNIYFIVPLQPLSNTHVQNVYVGDLDGDGEYDFVLDREPDVAGVTSKVEAYKRDGTFLWRVDLGPLSLNRNGIEGGAAALANGMNDGFTVFDMDNDGKAEVLLKTAKGTLFPDGSVVNHTDSIGNFLSVLSGLTGNELARTQLPTDYKSDGALQTQFNIGYLDGIMPSVIISAKNRIGSGDFNKLLVTYDYRNGILSQRWKWLRGDLAGAGEHEFHQQRIVDVDGDGKDEIVDGGYTVDDNGTLKYVIKGVAHGDRFHVGDLDPTRPGLEGYGIQQNNSSGLAWFYYDAETGEILHGQYLSSVADYARGDVGDYDPRYLGCEMYTFTDGIYNVSGKRTSTTHPWPNFSIWWDGDLLRELLNENIMDEWNYATSTTSRVLTMYKFNNSTVNSRNVPPLYGDIMGDWREEMIFESSNHDALNIFTPTAYTSDRIYTLAHNPEYRLCMTTRGYYQSTQTDFYLGAGMAQPPVPAMQTAKSVWKGDGVNNVWDSGVTSNWVINGVAGNYTDGDDVMFDISGNAAVPIQLTGTLSPLSVKVISPVDYIFAGTGTMSGSTGILKAGNGSLSLNMNSTFTDSVLVQQGSVFINTSLAKSTVKVSWGAGLGGNGTVVKGVILASGSSIQPGKKDESGTLTFGSDLTLPSNGICVFDLTDDSLGISKPSDKIVVKGNLTISDTLTFKFNKLDGIVKPGIYPLITYSGSLHGSISKIAVTGLFGQKCTLSNTDGIISITVEASRSASVITWSGTDSAWDLQTTPGWLKDNEQETFVANDSVLFNEIGRNNSNVNIIGDLPVNDIVVDASANNYSFSGTGSIVGAGGLTKSGSGILSLLTTNSYLGKTLVNGGKLEINSIADGGTSSSIGATSETNPTYFTLNNAYLKYSGAKDVFTDRGLTLAGITDTIDVVPSGKMFIWKGLITGSGRLVKKGSGIMRMILSSNNYTGGTVIQEGVISLGDNTANSSGLGSGDVIFEGGTLNMFSGTSFNFMRNFVVDKDYSGTLYASNRCSYKGTLIGDGVLNIYLPGTIDRSIFFGDWSAFTGDIKLTGVASSKFRIANSYGYGKASINVGSNVTVYHGGTGSQGGNSSSETVNIGALLGDAGSFLATENWIIGEKDLNTTFAGVISGNSLTKIGTGSLTLSGSNTYNGATEVDAGSLIVTGSISGLGAVSVNSGGTVAGTGYIGGAVSVNDGGIIAPGTTLTIGTLKLGNTLSLTSESSTIIKVNTLSNKQDTIRVGGNAVLNGTLNIQLQSGEFSVGNAFKIINAASYSGAFVQIQPAVPGEKMLWDLSTLSTDGTIRIISDPNTGLNEENSGADVKNINVFPNPAKDVINIQIDKLPEYAVISINEASGKCLVTTKTNNNLTPIDISKFTPGIYLLNVRINDYSKDYKFIKY